MAWNLLFMNKSEQSKINIIDKVKNNKKLQYLLIIGASILLILVFFFSNSTTVKNTAKSFNENDYVNSLEDRLEHTLSMVEGVGKVSVVITIESGMETVLATKVIKTQTSSGVETKEEPIIVNGKTVVIKEKYPKIIGVMIVAEGADRIAVINKIQQATTSLLEIDVGQIEILKMR